MSLIRIYDPTANTTVQVDSGTVSMNALLLNILIELRVHTMYLERNNFGILSDDPAQLRKDVVNSYDKILGN